MLSNQSLIAGYYLSVSQVFLIVGWVLLTVITTVIVDRDQPRISHESIMNQPLSN